MGDQVANSVVPQKIPINMRREEERRGDVGKKKKKEGEWEILAEIVFSMFMPSKCTSLKI